MNPASSHDETNCGGPRFDQHYRQHHQHHSSISSSSISSPSPPFDQHSSPASSSHHDPLLGQQLQPIRDPYFARSSITNEGHRSRRTSLDSVGASSSSHTNSPNLAEISHTLHSSRPARIRIPTRSPYSRESSAIPPAAVDDDDLVEQFAGANMDYISASGEEWSESEQGDHSNFRSNASPTSSVSSSSKKFVIKKENARSSRASRAAKRMDDYDEGGDDDDDYNEEEATDLRTAEERRIIFEQSAGAFRSAKTNVAKDKARGAFVQAWFKHSYSINIDGAVERQAMYSSYIRVCEAYSVKSINSASFGKAVRQAFPRIKTRRLGNRGNSRYHYCGIEPSSATESAILEQIERHVVMKASTTDSAQVNETQYASTSVNDVSMEPLPQDSVTPVTPTTARPKDPSKPISNAEQQAQRPAPRKYRKKALVISVPANNITSSGAGLPRANQNPIAFQPIPLPPALLNRFPTIDSALRIAGLTLDRNAAIDFWHSYTNHLHQLLDVMRLSKFAEFGGLSQQWWSEIGDLFTSTIQHPEISNLIYRADASLYDEILEVLHSRILETMPAQEFTSLRALADNMEAIQTRSLASFDGSAFLGPKIELAARFGHLLIRHLGLCQLGQAMSGIVSDPTAMKDLASGWDLIDFESIKNQSALVSNCSHELLGECFESFRHYLRNAGANPSQSIIQWVDAVFQRCIIAANNTTSPRSLLIRFNFVTSQIIRDLVLRSSPSFGSWQIISLFLEEFLAFQVLRRVALHITGVAESIGTNDQISPAQAYPYDPSLHYATLSQQYSQPQSIFQSFPSPPRATASTTATTRRSPEFDTQSNHSHTSSNSVFPYLDQFSPSTREFLESYDATAPAPLTGLPRHALQDSGYQSFSSRTAGLGMAMNVDEFGSQIGGEGQGAGVHYYQHSQSSPQSSNASGASGNSNFGLGISAFEGYDISDGSPRHLQQIPLEYSPTQVLPPAL